MKKKETSSFVPFQQFEAAVKRILSLPKKEFDKALASRPRRPKKPPGGH